MLTTRNLPYIPASITYNRPIGQARYGQSAPACLRKGFAIIQQARHSYQPNQVHFRLGLQVHFQLLPTPPCGDAVTFSCAPGLVRKRPDFHGLISCFRNRTVPPLQGGNIPQHQTQGFTLGWYLLPLQGIFRPHSVAPFPSPIKALRHFFPFSVLSVAHDKARDKAYHSPLTRCGSAALPHNLPFPPSLSPGCPAVRVKA